MSSPYHNKIQKKSKKNHCPAQKRHSG